MNSAPRRARALMYGAAGLPMMSEYEWFSMTTTTVCAGSGTAADGAAADGPAAGLREAAAGLRETAAGLRGAEQPPQAASASRTAPAAPARMPPPAVLRIMRTSPPSVAGEIRRLRCGYGKDPGGHRVVDRQDADRVRLVSARGGHAGEAAAVLRPAVPAGRGGLELLRAARLADRRVVGAADPGRVHVQRPGVQPVHPAPDAGQGAADGPARGG